MQKLTITFVQLMRMNRLPSISIHFKRSAGSDTLIRILKEMFKTFLKGSAREKRVATLKYFSKSGQAT